jgi:hypothetical protein
MKVGYWLTVGIEQRVVDDPDRCSLPTFLMAIHQVEMTPEMMEAVQLRYKYCKKKHQNHHLPMTYQWDALSIEKPNYLPLSKPFPDIYSSSLELSVWMGLFAKYLK